LDPVHSERTTELAVEASQIEYQITHYSCYPNVIETQHCTFYCRDERVNSISVNKNANEKCNLFYDCRIVVKLESILMEHDSKALLNDLAGQ
jgi:hypothetical protein